jgi:hypothetical protein
MLQMRQQHERTVGAESDHHMVSSETGRSQPGSSRLSQHVRDEGQLGTACLMVGLLIVDEFDRAGHGSQKPASKPDKDLR